ncbi:phage tail tape measure protein [Paenibacillus sp. HJGM_3]|uniref:phage tail tape measure protein n=1 Tax=Paenibacillus sp. HJGM_3 TaxID=3379816 RepID=UPI00385954D8
MANENDIGGKVGLDVTEFKAGIAELNRQIKVIDSGFKAAAAGMDDWSKSEEGLQERITSLNQITDLQRQKIANLTNEYERIAAEKGETSKAAQDLQVRINKETEALNKNMLELNKSTAALKSFGDESEATTKDVDHLDKSVDEAQQALKEIGGNVAKAAAAGVAAIGAAAVTAIGGLLNFSGDSTRAMNKLQAQTGATAEQMAEFRDTAKAIYTSNLGESIDDVANSMASVKQVTQQTGDELENTTRKALLMRDTFGFDVPESINTVNSLMDKFGITADQAYTLIAQGAQNGANKNGDLLDVLNEYAPQFSALGFSAEQFTDILIQGAQDGAFQVDKVGDAIKEFTIRSKDMSTGTNEAFTTLGLDAQKMGASFAAGGEKAQGAFREVLTALNGIQDPLIRNQVGVQLFGTQFEDLEASAILSLGNVQNVTSSTADTLQQINEIRYDDAGSALEGLKRQLITSLADPIEEKLKPKILEMTESLKNVDVTPIVNGLTWIIDNAGNLAAVAASIGAGMAAWNVATMIQGVVKAIQAWRVATEGMTIAQIALNAAQALNPIALVITLVAALVAGIIVLWNTNDDFRNALIGAWKAIENAGKALWKWLVSFFTEDIPKAFRTALDWFKKLPEEAARFFNELPGKIGYALGFGLGKMVQFGLDALDWVKTEVPKIIAAIVDFFVGLPGRIASALSNALKAMGSWFVDMVQLIKDEGPGIISNIVDFFSGLPGDMLNIGKNIVTGLWDGISAMTGWIKDKIKGFASGIVSGIKDVLDIHSPSRVMRDQVGMMIGAGMAEGIVDSTRQVHAAMEQLNGQVSLNQAGTATAGRVGQIAGTSTTNTYNFEGMLSGAVFNVRNEGDIMRTAREIGNLVLSEIRG